MGRDPSDNLTVTDKRGHWVAASKNDNLPLNLKPTHQPPQIHLAQVLKQPTLPKPDSAAEDGAPASPMTLLCITLQVAKLTQKHIYSPSQSFLEFVWRQSCLQLVLGLVPGT